MLYSQKKSVKLIYFTTFWAWIFFLNFTDILCFFLSSVPMFGFWMGGRCLVSAHSDRKFVNKGQ